MAPWRSVTGTVLDAETLSRGLEEGDGSPRGELRSYGGGSVLQLRCPFATSPTPQRFMWDSPVRLDLSESAGLELDISCTDPTPVSQFNVYVRSAGTWHAAQFAISEPGRWNRVLLTKAGFDPEGTPRGWNAVDAIRIAAWRGAARDTVLHLRSIRVVSPTVRAALLRAGSGAASSARAEAARYCRHVSGALARYGLFPAVIDDSEVTAPMLARYGAVIVPSCQGLSGRAGAALAAYLRGGGRAVLFYELPDDVRVAAGLPEGRFLLRSGTGDMLAGLRFSGGGVRGSPASVAQGSRALMATGSSPAGCAVAATWYDVHGRCTGLPAVVLSGRAVWMTHVYLAKDSENGPRMVLAMLAHLLPEIWEKAARTQLVDLAGALQRAGASATRAVRFYEAGRRLHASGQYPQALDFVSKSTSELARGTLSQVPAPRGEFRGAWCRSWEGLPGLGWEGTARVAAECGLNALLPDMADGGSAGYPSRYLPRRPPGTGADEDPLAACAAACRRHGIQLHVWKRCFSLAEHSSDATQERWKRAGRLQVDSSGRTLSWLCPNHPENRALELAVMEELATQYTIGGIHLDFIRYPSSGACVCEHCRRAFGAWLGRPLPNWPAALEERGSVREEWLEFRRDTITSFVREVRAALRRVSPNLLLSAAVFPNAALARSTVGQDWGTWCRLGLLDFVCPMSYHGDSAAFLSDVLRQQGTAAGSRAAVFPGIGVSSCRLDPLALAEQISGSRTRRTGGFVLFEFGMREARDVLPAIRDVMQ